MLKPKFQTKPFVGKPLQKNLKKRPLANKISLAIQVGVGNFSLGDLEAGA